MRSTLVGVFDDRQAAEHARDELLRAGFADDEVDLRTGAEDRAWRESDDRRVAADRRAYEDETQTSIGETVADWFRSLFGFDDEQDAGIYAEALRRGESVVTVDASDGDRLDRATDILEDCGSVDIDAMANEWQLQGWARPSGAGDTRAIPVVEERSRIGKRVVGRRRLRVYTRLVEEPGAAGPDEGAARPDPGAARPDPGAARSDPGAMRSDPGATRSDI